MNGNFIGTDGARHLMGAIKVNNTLSYLGLQVCLNMWGDGGGVERGCLEGGFCFNKSA